VGSYYLTFVTESPAKICDWHARSWCSHVASNDCISEDEKVYVWLSQNFLLAINTRDNQLWCFMVHFRSCSTHFRCGFRMMKHRWSGFNFQDFKHAPLMQSLKLFQDSFVFLIWQVLSIYVSYQLNIMTIQFLNSLGGLLATWKLALRKLEDSIPL